MAQRVLRHGVALFRSVLVCLDLFAARDDRDRSGRDGGAVPFLLRVALDIDIAGVPHGARPDTWCSRI
jgi:hypothetical protein